MASPIAVMDSHALTWPLELESWTRTHWRGPSTLVYALPRFGVAPEVGVMKSHASVWPLESGTWTPTLWCGPLKLGSWTPVLRYDHSSWGYGLPRFGLEDGGVV